jgi:hypothetical protein
MNFFKLKGFTFSILRSLTFRYFNLKNVFIFSLFCFLVSTVLFPIESFLQHVYSHNENRYKFIKKLKNQSIRVKNNLFYNGSNLNLNVENAFNNSYNYIDLNNITYALNDNVISIEFNQNNSNKMQFDYDLLFAEASLIKNSIKNAFLSVKIQIEYCPLFLENLEGPLNVTSILESIGLNNLVQFHGPNSFNLSSNNYNENKLPYLDEAEYEKNKNNTIFKEFWDIWHSSDLNLLNRSGSEFSNVDLGGHWKPTNCLSLYRIAIIVPYRDRLPHLKVLISYLHIILKRQMLDYRIIVVEPTTPLDIKFNKGRVMNSGNY